MDWTNQKEILAKREAAIKAGYKPAVIDEFIKKKKEEAAAISLMQQGVTEVGKIAESNPLLAQKAIQMGVQPKPAMTDLEQKEKSKITGVEQALELLKQNLGEAETSGPVMGRLVGFANLLSGGGVAPEVADYEALRKSLIGPLARSISGEVGVLTDKDISRAEGLLPKITDSAKLRENKLKNLARIIEKKKGTSSGKADNADPLGLGL